AGWINRTACAEDYGGGPGSKTADCAMAVRHRRCGARRCNPKACCLIGPAVRSALRTRSSPPIRGNVADVRHGATAPFTQSGAVLLGSPVPNAGQWLGSTPAGCEVCRESLQ